MPRRPARPRRDARVSSLAKCELVVRGPCEIYTDKFWEMQAKYAHREFSFGVYPGPPDCYAVCPAVMVELFPDGTFGGAWALDPCAVDGWRPLRWPYEGPTCLPPPFDTFE